MTTVIIGWVFIVLAHAYAFSCRRLIAAQKELIEALENAIKEGQAMTPITLTLTITVTEDDARAMVSNWGCSTGNYTSRVANAIAAALPPETIRRRITWADLQDVPPRDWEGVAIVDDSTAPDPIHPKADIYWWLPWFRADHGNWAVIEVPATHPLATAGEPA